MYNVTTGLRVSTLLSYLPSGPYGVDPYKECPTHCGIRNAHNNSNEV